MRTAQKIKIIPILFLLWALPLSMLPRAIARPLATARTEAKTPPRNESQLKMTTTEAYGNLPLSFEPNLGQSADQVKFLSRGKGYTLFLTPSEAVFSLRSSSEKKTAASVLRMIGNYILPGRLSITTFVLFVPFCGINSLDV